MKNQHKIKAYDELRALLKKSDDFQHHTDRDDERFQYVSVEFFNEDGKPRIEGNALVRLLRAIKEGDYEGEDALQLARRGY